MIGCSKKVSAPPNNLKEEIYVDCDAPLPEVVEIGNAITILVCKRHHVEIAEALRTKLRRLRRLQTNLMALVSGYGRVDIDMKIVEQILFAVEACEDEIREYVTAWMSKPGAPPEAA